MDKINTLWFKEVPSKDHDKRRELVLAAPNILEALASVLLAEIAELGKTSTSDYDVPNWALKEADRKGQIRSLQKVLDLTKRTA